MRAYGFVRTGGPEQEAFLDLPVPAPGAGEIVVAVRAAGVNPGDWKVRAGAYGVEPPAALGREVAGTVTAVGSGVERFTLGEEVFGGCPDMIGGWAERARVTADFAARLPPSVRPEQAAVLPVAAGTAYDGLTALDLPPGATLVVNGAGGGVGLPLVQLARARGVVVVAIAGPAKHDLLAGLGAVPVAYGSGLRDRLRTAAPSVDAVFDLVGGQALAAVAELLVDRARLISVADRALAVRLGGRELVRDRSATVLAELAAQVATGALDPLVGVRPFDDAAAALAEVEAGHTTGKIALVMEPLGRARGA